MKIVLVLLLTVSCASPAWLERPADFPEEWRGRTVYVGDAAVVLATSQSAAWEVSTRIAWLRGRLERVLGWSVGPGLVVVVDAEDPLFMEDAGELWRALQDAHVRAVGGEGAEVVMPAEPGELVRAVAAGVPRRSAILDLPAAIEDRCEWIVVVPTARALGDVVHARPELDTAVKRRRVMNGLRFLVHARVLAAMATGVDVPQDDGTAGIVALFGDPALEVQRLDAVLVLLSLGELE